MIKLPKTKIVATIGPASNSPELIEKLISAGVSVFRFNMKHGDHRWHSLRMALVRETSLKLKRPVAIMMDLQGPEVRIGEFKDGKIYLEKGEKVYFAATTQKNLKTIILNSEPILAKIKPGQQILLADGFFEFRVIENKDNKILAEVIEGGILGSKKNVTLPGVKIDLPTLIERDIEDISLAAKEDIDFFALSFVRDKKDIETLRKVLVSLKLNAQIIAKIENQQAIENFEEILATSDGVMIARGDLGIQLPMEKVPYYQKLMIQRCRDIGKPVITATQMLESMVENPRPTRAEVNDVANAIYDHTDAIMLSAESASGKYPVKAVETMVKIASFIEDKETIENEPLPFDQAGAIASSVYDIATTYLPDEEDLVAICVFTSSGKTARFMSRLRPTLPIYAFTPSSKVRDQLCLSWGITPFYTKKTRLAGKEVVSRKDSIQMLKELDLVKKGEKLIMTYGNNWGVPGETNTIRIQIV